MSAKDIYFQYFLSHADLKCAILREVRKKLNIAKNNACKSETRMEGKCVTDCPRNNNPYLLAEKEVFMNAKTSEFDQWGKTQGLSQTEQNQVYLSALLGSSEPSP